MEINKRDFILDNISMIEILDKYGIKRKRNMFSCPFHGVDKTPSAKAYKNSCYCFACNRASDTIGFVQDYFNLSFKEALEKINQDFGLNLQSNTRISKQKLEELRKQKELKEQQKVYINKQLVKACKRYIVYENIIKKLKKNINVYNWEDNTLAILFLEDKLDKIDNYMENLQNKRLEL